MASRHEPRRLLLDWIFDFIFPPRCIGCKARGNWLCASCKSTASHVPSAICSRCGSPTPQTQTCSTCWKMRPKFDAVRAEYFFEGIVRQAIHMFKYKGARHLVGPLTNLLLESVEPRFSESDVVVPVPLHPERLKERSYNQSQLLAAEVGKVLGISLVDDCLVRTCNTEPQMRLPAELRASNVRHAFACVDRTLDGKKVLLVDDVYTTGATLNECATTLKKAGATVVWGVCVARAR